MSRFIDISFVYTNLMSMFAIKNH